MKLLFYLISKIADNHHLTPDFFSKLENVIHLKIKNDLFLIFDHVANCGKSFQFFKPDLSFIEII